MSGLFRYLQLNVSFMRELSRIGLSAKSLSLSESLITISTAVLINYCVDS